MAENACDLYRETGRIDPQLIGMIKGCDLLTVKSLVDTDITFIKAQIDEAKGRAAATGDYSDREWFRKAMSSLRIKGLLSQRIQTELGKRRQERKNRNREENERRTVALLMRAIGESLPEDWRQKVLDRFHLLTLENPPPRV
jgi:hypothetical protein